MTYIYEVGFAQLPYHNSREIARSYIQEDTPEEAFKTFMDLESSNRYFDLKLLKRLK